MHREDNGWEQKMAAMLIQSVFGAGIAIIFSILILAVSALAILKGFLGEDMLNQLVMGSCMLGAFAGALLSRKKENGNCILYGILVSLVQFTIMYLIGGILFGARAVNGQMMLFLISCLCGGSLSGIVVPRKKGRGRRPTPVRKRKK